MHNEQQRAPTRQRAPKFRLFAGSCASNTTALLKIMALSEPGGMYCTKVRCTVRATEGIAGGIIPRSKYITIGDNYVDVKDTLPGRWKEKQFAMNRAPSLCPEQKLTGQGYFGYNKFAFKAPDKGKDPYVEQVGYLKKQPPESRKSGFGSRDATKFDEFSQTIRTQQYRDTLKKEQKIMDAKKDHAAEAAMVAKYDAAAAAKLEKEGPSYLYDIGRGKTTQFDPKAKKDAFYKAKEKYSLEHPINLGPYMTASRDIGSTAWSVAKKRPAPKGAVSGVKDFFDNSHLEIEGF